MTQYLTSMAVKYHGKSKTDINYKISDERNEQLAPNSEYIFSIGSNYNFDETKIILNHT